MTTSPLPSKPVDISGVDKFTTQHTAKNKSEWETKTGNYDKDKKISLIAFGSITVLEALFAAGGGALSAGGVVVTTLGSIVAPGVATVVGVAMLILGASILAQGVIGTAIGGVVLANFPDPMKEKGPQIFDEISTNDLAYLSFYSSRSPEIDKYVEVGILTKESGEKMKELTTNYNATKEAINNLTSARRVKRATAPAPVTGGQDNDDIIKYMSLKRELGRLEKEWKKEQNEIKKNPTSVAAYEPSKRGRSSYEWLKEYRKEHMTSTKIREFETEESTWGVLKDLEETKGKYLDDLESVL